MLTWIALHPALVVAAAYQLACMLVAALPVAWRSRPIVGVLVRALGRVSYLTHADAAGTLKWPGVAHAAETAVETAMMEFRAARASVDPGTSHDRETKGRTMNPDETPARNFGLALAAMKSGHRVSRDGWDGKGMFLFMVFRTEWSIAPPSAVTLGLKCKPFIAMKTADNELVPWLASQTDMLADDWSIEAIA